MRIIKHPAAISAGHEITLEVAESILNLGGNAFDAAISAFFAMFITEPCMASAGAGGFAMCYPKNEKKPILLDFFTQTPMRKDLNRDIDFFPINVPFGEENEEFHLGMASIATPGAIAAIYDLHDRYCTIPMHILIDACSHLAKDGVKINTFQAFDLGLLEPIFAIDPDVKSIFFKNDNILKEGDQLYMPQLGDFYQFLIDEGRKGFYQGEISQKIHETSINNGGFIRRSDLENYSCIWRSPSVTPINQYQLYTPSHPSMGGMIMSILAHLRFSENKTWVNAIREIKEEFSTPEKMAKKITEITGQAITNTGTPNTKGTSHFNIVDQWGNAISLTSSIGEGSGYFIPETNMQMNNMLGEDYLLPNGFHSWKTNQRMLSMMSPTMVFDNNDLKYIGGSGGAGRIPYAIMQVIENVLLEKMTLKEATSANRLVIHDRTIHCEGTCDEFTDIESYEAKSWNRKSMFFGGVHSILMYNDSKIEAEGDPRRYGVSKIL